MPLALLQFLVIDINIDPTMFEVGPFTLTWHGFFTAVGILAGVTLSVYLAKKDGVPSEIGQEIALVAVPSAIIGARLFYCAEHWDQFSDNPARIITDITEGGITLYGGLIGGVLGGLAYGLWRHLPIAILLDAAAPGMILGQGIGRIGDLINGEHHADETGLWWAVRYVHPNTLGEIGLAVHPTAGGYELVGDMVILLALVFVLRKYLKTPGWVFCSYMALYGVMRFVLSYTRTDEATIGDVPVPQIVAAVTVGLAIILAAVLARWPGPITREYAERVWGDPTATKPPSESTTAPA
jgi:phosphatidylglycerol:prolipoprotein diacylglycerol transferase